MRVPDPDEPGAVAAHRVPAQVHAVPVHRVPARDPLEQLEHLDAPHLPVRNFAVPGGGADDEEPVLVPVELGEIRVALEPVQGDEKAVVPARLGGLRRLEPVAVHRPVHPRKVRLDPVLPLPHDPQLQLHLLPEAARLHHQVESGLVPARGLGWLHRERDGHLLARAQPLHLHLARLPAAAGPHAHRGDVLQRHQGERDVDPLPPAADQVGLHGPGSVRVEGRFDPHEPSSQLPPAREPRHLEQQAGSPAQAQRDRVEVRGEPPRDRLQEGAPAVHVDGQAVLGSGEEDVAALLHLRLRVGVREAVLEPPEGLEALAEERGEVEHAARAGGRPEALPPRDLDPLAQGLGGVQPLDEQGVEAVPRERAVREWAADDELPQLNLLHEAARRGLTISFARAARRASF